jgi:hypothetical protein
MEGNGGDLCIVCCLEGREKHERVPHHVKELLEEREVHLKKDQLI